jgi:hypothetical protein
MLVFAVTTPSRLVSSDSPHPPLTLAAIGLAGSDVLVGSCDALHGGGGRSLEPPTGCVIVRLSPQLR